MSGPVSNSRLLKQLSWQHTSFAPAQVFGGVRLVPLLRSEYREDLRLAKRVYADTVKSVDLNDGNRYRSYIPHGLIAHWSKEGDAVIGTRLSESEIKHDSPQTDHSRSGTLSRMAKRNSTNILRFLPQHVAIEGYLSHHFGGPDIAWSEYRKSTFKHGLGQRTEYLHSGRNVVGLEDALRVFERHENQIGMMIFVADSLAAVFIVPHPEDYKILQKTLLTDFYGELIYYYGLVNIDSNLRVPSINSEKIDSFEDLYNEVDRIVDGWGNWHEAHTGALFNTPIQAKGVYNLKPFTLQRFSTGFNPDHENHIGEVIADKDNTVQYLKTFRLSANQCKRAYLLSKLAESQWSLEHCAKTLTCTKNELILRMRSAGFGYLIHPHVLEAAVRNKQ